MTISVFEARARTRQARQRIAVPAIASGKVALFIDPSSHHFEQDRLFIVDDGRLNGDRINAPFAHLRDVLNGRGIPVRTADYLPQQPNGTRNIYVSMGRL